MLLALSIRRAETVFRRRASGSEESRHHCRLGFENVFHDGLANRIRARRAGDYPGDPEASESLDLESGVDLAESCAGGLERSTGVGRRDVGGICEAAKVRVGALARDSGGEVRGAWRRILRVSK